MLEEPSHGELDINVLRTGREAYEVELRLRDPNTQVELAPARGPAAIDLLALLERQAVLGEYGKALSQQLFSDEQVRSLYRRGRAVLERGERSLRVRLFIGATAPELHDLRWELLCDPDTGESFSTSERILFSRFLTSDDFRPVKLRPRARLKALIAIAAPTDLEQYKLSPIDRAQEVARASAALSELSTEVIGQNEPLTLDRLLDGLRSRPGAESGVDILYLVCHGRLNRQLQPALFLQNEEGGTAVVKGEELARRLRELLQPPRLVVLASCESGGIAEATALEDTPSAALASLAQLLAQAGAAATLAMQGRITQETVRLFMPRFFRELLVDGQIDRAMAVARGAVRHRLDSFIPVLYLRLKSGRIWYEPRMTGGNTPSQWKALCQCVQSGHCIPILGPDLDESLFGGVRNLASELALLHGFPNAEHERRDLAKVAQFLSIEKGRGFAQKAVQSQLIDQLSSQLDAQPGAPRDATISDGAKELPRLLDSIVEKRRERDDDPYAAVARLPVSIYISASPETLLVKTLKAAGKTPEPLFCRWRPTSSNTPQEPRPKGPPTSERPIVYHVFGVFGAPDSLVLTEDDFFDFLIATSTYKLMPTVVRGSLTDSALLFLGFRLDDWTFRVLFRLIMTLEGAAGMRKYAHVGVQLNPEEHSLADVERARRYLERYFGSDRGGGLSEPPITLYWGSSHDFVKELQERLKETQAEAAPATETAGENEWF